MVRWCRACARSRVRWPTLPTPGAGRWEMARSPRRSSWRCRCAPRPTSWSCGWSRPLPAGTCQVPAVRRRRPAWLSATQRLSRQDAGGLARLAAALDGRYEASRQALAAGLVRTEQARVITHALDELPRTVSVDDRRRAEQWLLDKARVHGPDELRRLGKRIFEVIDPDLADQREGRAARGRGTARAGVQPAHHAQAGGWQHPGQLPAARPAGRHAAHRAGGAVITATTPPRATTLTADG